MQMKNAPVGALTKTKSRWGESNPQPRLYESRALPLSYIGTWLERGPSRCKIRNPSARIKANGLRRRPDTPGPITSGTCVTSRIGVRKTAHTTRPCSAESSIGRRKCTPSVAHGLPSYYVGERDGGHPSRRPLPTARTPRLSLVRRNNSHPLPERESHHTARVFSCARSAAPRHHRQPLAIVWSASRFPPCDRPTEPPIIHRQRKDRAPRATASRSVGI